MADPQAIRRHSTGGSWQPRGRGRGYYRNGTNRQNGHQRILPADLLAVAELGESSQQIITELLEANQGPYSGWKLYNKQESFKEGSPTVVKVRAVEGFISRHPELVKTSEVKDRRAFPVDLKVLMSDDVFMDSWPDFANELIDSPEKTLNILGLAMHQVVCEALKLELSKYVDEDDDSTPPKVELPVVRARIIGHEPVIQLKQLKANYFGKLVTIRGTIIRVGGLKLQCTWLAYSCNQCGLVQAVRQPEGAFTQPSSCVQKGCRSKTFTPLHSHKLTQTSNWQTVKLQENLDDDQREGGRVPRTLEVELTEDLVETCVPGDEVTVTGVVKVLNSEEVKQKGPNMFLLYLDAVSLTSNKNNGGLTSSGDIKFNTRDNDAIKAIHSEPDLFRLMVNSLCPSIYGHEMVKAGLLLALIGGTPREPSSGRSDVHVLVVGDPGLGKSQMLHAVTSIAPRGVYVCGNTSTTSGLTVTLTRESGGDFALEAGALVLADQGCCCIDEFDKMSNQHQALLETMEQQSVSVAKAGVVCSLPARASVLAAANPIGGHYNRAKTVAENLKMGPALLSRFDLVFILLDQPNEHLDSLLSEHIMALHSGKKIKMGTFDRSRADSQLSSFSANVPLSEKLKQPRNEPLDPIPPQLLRKYIAYAKKNVHPKLSNEAAEVIQKFYLKLRSQRGHQDCTPVTTRQLESLIRLTEARAKLELRKEATEEDAQDVVELMKHSLLDTFCDELGSLDFQRSQNGSGTSSRSQAKKFIGILQRKAELQTKSLFTVSEMKEVAAQARIVVPDFSNFVATLNLQGFLLKKGANIYQLQSVDY
ncbi:DNA helicase MCM8 [Neocloeon triangulifer]|uniref:DNA helicase MCM8 n=1 Tax=Neocloeon triangulifer TaxID=2078957 RepID=UPI00286F4385|nr:DNA helicase MCM8 [Neocloeon triangulifer]